MEMLEWAKNEVAIASKRERGYKPENEWITALLATKAQ